MRAESPWFPGGLSCVSFVPRLGAVRGLRLNCVAALVLGGLQIAGGLGVLATVCAAPAWAQSPAAAPAANAVLPPAPPLGELAPQQTPAPQTTAPQITAPAATTPVPGPPITTTPASLPPLPFPVRNPGAGPAPSDGTTNAGSLAGSNAQQPTVAEEQSLTTTEWQWNGLRVEEIRFAGVTFPDSNPLAKIIRAQVGHPLSPASVRQSLRDLFKTGRYQDIGLSGTRNGDSVTLIFTGTPLYYVGRVEITGVKDDRLASLLEYSANLNPGTAFTQSAVPAATDLLLQTLAQNGYYQPRVIAKAVPDDGNKLMNVSFRVTIGPQARVGKIVLSGDNPGMTLEEFQKKARLKRGSKVTRETTSNALSKLRAQYQKDDHLEATVTLQKSTYDPAAKQLNYEFRANQGPLVKVSIEGASVSKSRLHLLVPVFEEGTVDNDLLNEGLFNIREFMQREGYFDATAEVKVIDAGAANEQIVYSVARGIKRKVISVTINGNKYFEADLLKERMQVQKADEYLRSGRYSATLLSSDVKTIEALYRANGFGDAKVATAVTSVVRSPSGKPLREAGIDVALTIEEGSQQKFGSVVLSGIDDSRTKEVRALLNAQAGQPFSSITLTGDRDAVLSYYLSHGFDQARVEIKQTKDTADPNRLDVNLNVTEGEQVFVKGVLISGDNRTRPKLVQRTLQVHAGDALNQSALLETQRQFYNLALFNEVNVAVQNPSGQDTEKDVLVQLTEAKRWDVTYGFGFEAATGEPSSGQISEASKIQLGLNPNQTFTQEGRTGVSPRISFDVSRINLFGTDKSLTLHTTYGLLEEIATLSFNNPHLFGTKNFSSSISGGYSNVQDISTFQASTLEGDLRLTEKLHRTDTFIYDFVYRRVAVNPNSLEVSANLIPQQSEPVRVGGPSLTWFHDTREPSPLDATKGSYTSVVEFIASSKFGSQTSFNRIDGSNSTYYAFGKRKYVLARNTRLGFENVFGKNPNAGNQECLTNAQVDGMQVNLLTTNASCDAVPLPERLYAGGASSHRGFPINGAGPRDLQTGFPVGGTAVFVNTTELRLPAPTLPYVGDTISFVLFHDMGNVFQNASDLFPSFLHFHQPNQQSCNNVSGSIGTCNFNYFSQALGLGLRYKTPVGPIRADFSYNINPPRYPVIYDFNGSNPYPAQASHFNFFFSIGQSF
jgi:outer membrane protein insertion porin family